MNEKAFLAKYALYDCRYPYEYTSGHIQVRLPPPIGMRARSSAAARVAFFCARFYFSAFLQFAQNLYEVSLIENAFFPSHKRIPIFYCEFSQQRGPTMYVRARRRNSSASAAATNARARCLQGTSAAQYRSRA